MWVFSNLGLSNPEHVFSLAVGSVVSGLTVRFPCSAMMEVGRVMNFANLVLLSPFALDRKPNKVAVNARTDGRGIKCLTSVMLLWVFSLC